MQLLQPDYLLLAAEAGWQGASGAIVLTDSVPELRKCIDLGYKRAYPDLKSKYAVHVVQVVDALHCCCCCWCWVGYS